MSYSVDLDLNYTISVAALQPQYDTKGDTFMKKTLCLILAVCMMLLCLAACSSGKTTDADKTDAASNAGFTLENSLAPFCASRCAWAHMAS